MRIRTACLALALALAGAVSAQPAVEVADGRLFDALSDPSAWEGHPLLQRASEAARAYWAGQDPTLEEERRVLASADGAFTEPGAEQHAVLYLVSRWPRCCPKVGLAVIEGDRLVQNVTFEGAVHDLAAVADLDGDGRDEFVFLGEFGMGGQVSRSLTLASFRAGGLAAWGGTSIYDGACAAGVDGAVAARVLARPGPEFLVERYTQPSCAVETWEAAGAPEPLVLDAPAETPYVALAVE